MARREKKNPGKILFVAGGSAFSALLGSLCLLGPLLFAGAGTAGLAAALARGTGSLIPFAPFFWLAAIGGFGAVFYGVYRAPGCYPRWTRRVLTGGAALVLLLGVFLAAAEAGETREVQLRVEGLQGRACVKLVRRGLSETPGVKGVKIDKKFFSSTGTVTVRFDPGITSPGDLILAVETQGTPVTPYKAFLLPDPPPGNL